MIIRFSLVKGERVSFCPGGEAHEKEHNGKIWGGAGRHGQTGCSSTGRAMTDGTGEGAKRNPKKLFFPPLPRKKEPYDAAAFHLPGSSRRKGGRGGKSVPIYRSRVESTPCNRCTCAFFCRCCFWVGCVLPPVTVAAVKGAFILRKEMRGEKAGRKMGCTKGLSGVGGD